MNEIPEHLREKPKVEKIEVNYGRGNRQRKEVNYSDKLSELQFMKLVEEGKNPMNREKRIKENGEIDSKDYESEDQNSIEEDEIELGSE